MQSGSPKQKDHCGECQAAKQTAEKSDQPPAFICTGRSIGAREFCAASGGKLFFDAFEFLLSPGLEVIEFAVKSVRVRLLMHEPGRIH